MAVDEKLVVEELLTKPSAVSPTLFVGLGGAGCKIAVRIARHLKRRPDYEERFKDLVKFALVDTNINDLESYREQADETFLISDFEKEEYASFASGLKFVEADPYFTQWVPQNYRFRAGDTAGAGQIRIESRLGCYYQMKHGDFVPRFRRLLESLKSHEHGHRRLDSSEIRIVLCFSVAGGTGSGSFLTIAYMLRDQAKALGKPSLIGVSVLPGVFEDKTGANKDGTFANGYAALKEAEHLMRLGAPESRFFPTSGLEFHYDPSDESKRRVRERPFDFIYLIDKPESFSIQDPVAACADGLYLQFFSPLFGVQAGDYDNYTQHQRFLVPHDFEAKGIVGFSQFYGSFGAAVLLVPVPGLVQYCAQAAALDLMRSSFLGAIPGEPLYASLRNNPEPFYEVTEHDEEGARPLHLSEFHKKEEGIRKRLRDRLFSKRVRLLAACEHDENVESRFLEMFRHGHRAGQIPGELGNPRQGDEVQVTRAREQLADRGMNYSIGALVLDALCGDSPKAQPGLLQAVQRELESFEKRIVGDVPVSDKMLVREWKSKAAGWAEDLKRQGLRRLERGYTKHGTEFPGMEVLLDLKFLEDQTEEVSLAAKRFAVLAIREELKAELPDPRPFEGFELPERQDDDRVREKDAPMLIDALMDQAKKKALADIQRVFIEQRAKLRDKLASYAEVSRSLEMGFDLFERERTKQLERMREQGCDAANQYVLDAEALQIENNRRMWDFFYYDQIANLPELGLSNPRVQAELSGTVRDLSLRQGGGTTASLERLFDALSLYATTFLEKHVGGDPKALDKARRDGLTLSDSLELEVIYRALYMSNLDELRSRGAEAIRAIVAKYRGRPREEQLNLAEPIYQDYLRDKIKRVVKEKASLLCAYEDSRDQHGGVRPDNVFLAAIDADFKNSNIEQALRGADIAGLTWVEDHWHNPQAIIFYRAVLNVPLYVFGRMNEMKDYYYRFKNLAKRSKVLHTDKNWEDTLPDLDPDTAQEKHRQMLVRQHIVNFGALLTIRDPFFNNQGYIVRRDGHYYMRPPYSGMRAQSGSPQAAQAEIVDQLSYLGATLASSIERLPQVLDGEKVKYLPFQQLLNAVRAGIAPQILREVVKLPFQWRKNRDELRTQYGTTPTPEQSVKLRDYTESFYRLQEALDDLLDKLRNDEKERRTIGGDYSSSTAGLNEQDVIRNMRQSIEILRGFSESWRALEHPEESKNVPQTFRGLFKPLREEELNETLEWLHNGIYDENDGGTPSPTLDDSLLAGLTRSDDDPEQR